MTAAIVLPGKPLTTAQVAAELRVSRGRVLQWCREGDLPALRVGRAYRVWEKHVAAWRSILELPQDAAGTGIARFDHTA